MFGLFIHLCFAPIFVLPYIPLFLVSLGEDIITLAKQPLRSLHIPGIFHHFVGVLEKYCIGPGWDGKKLPTLEQYLYFLAEYQAGTGNLITKKNNEHFRLNKGHSRVYGWWPLDFGVGERIFSLPMIWVSY